MKYLFLIFSTLYVSLLANNDLEKVSLQLEWKYQFEFAGFIAAKEKGYYRDAGLDVELREYHNDVDIVTDVLSRKATYGVYNSSIVVNNGHIKPTVLLGTYFQRSPLVFVARKGIENPADMVGKKIMLTEDESKYSSLALLLNHFGISPKNAHIIKHSFVIQDFIDGKVDVMSAFRSNELYQIDKSGINYTIIDPSEYGFMMSAVNLFTSPEEAIEHTERTQRFIDATNLGWKYALDHPDETIEMILKHYSTKKSREALKYEAKVTQKIMMTDFYPIGETNGELTVRIYKQLLQTGALTSDEKLGHYLFRDIAEMAKGEISFSDDEKKYLHKKRKITMCVDPEWYPLEAIRDGKHIGLAADVMSVFESNIGIPIELIPTTSWNQSLVYAQQRKCDILSLAVDTPERLKYMNFTSNYLNIPYVMVTTNDKPFTEKIASLSHEKIGIVKGYSTIEILKDRYPMLNIIEVDSVTDGLRRVESGELYGYIDNLMVVSSYIQKQYTGILKVSSRLEVTDDLSVGTRNDEPELKTIFEKSVHHLDDVTMQRIYNRWASTIEERGWFDTTAILKILGLLVIIMMGVAWRYRVLKRYNTKLLALSVTDKLTGLYNRQKIDEILIREQKVVNRYAQYHCALMMIDVDFFKNINDTFGHQTGDEVLHDLAVIMKNNLRETDIVGRWGGEEFMIILPHTSMEEALIVAEGLRQKVEKFSFGENLYLTISIGLGKLMHVSEVHECVGEVDKALYQAKSNGRNQIIVAKS
ncbi:MAG: diguanylate cyclase [Sulfuricurvum sp.]|uniref:diguanylate cyclase n=1 Tax=Sulfuricurvum sp. TaxID=2025608 RepID=UPI00261D1514|nr:diguanylate cyclase [Sulfuricurvum sp.]MDD2829861.1 diguanylate cyclase [Sulfuricurvum sp.]MDD4949226.1 diguanylate cyclase [Sulfuricurvum sp.]